MAIQFQYNKTSLQMLEKNLKMRVRALPTIKNKESALRMEVKRAKDDIKKLEIEFEQRISAYDKMLALWGEFDTSLLKVDDVKMSIKKIGIDKTITDLAKFAKTQGVNYKILKIHNPWLRDKKLTVTTGKKYEIEIPTSGYNK